MKWGHIVLLHHFPLFAFQNLTALANLAVLIYIAFLGKQGLTLNNFKVDLSDYGHKLSGVQQPHMDINTGMGTAMWLLGMFLPVTPRRGTLYFGDKGKNTPFPSEGLSWQRVHQFCYAVLTGQGQSQYRRQLFYLLYQYLIMTRTEYNCLVMT